MELPEKNTTTTTSDGISYRFDPPGRVHRISSYALEANGWMRFSKLKWVKDGDNITYDGCDWKLNGEKKVEFFEDLPNYLKDKK